MSQERSIIACLVAVALCASLPVGSAGPFPAHDPLAHFLLAAEAEALESVDHTTAITRAVFTGLAETVNAAQGLRVANSSIETMFDETGTHGAAVVTNVGQAGVEGVRSAGDMARISAAYAEYVTLLGQNRLGVHVTGSQPPVSALAPTCVGGSIEILQIVLDAVPPGAEVPVCAGHYAGDLTLGTEFVTLRSVQGPYATTFSGTITVEASGVVISGFTIMDGGIVVGGAGDGYLGEIWGTLVYGNIVQGNGAGVMVGNAVGTLVAYNLIRGNGVGLSVQGLDAVDPALPGFAVVSVGNDFARSGPFAVHIAGDVPAPVVSVADHYGGLPPAVALTDSLCVGPGLTDTRCRGAVSLGVVVLAPSPVALPWL